MALPLAEFVPRTPPGHDTGRPGDRRSPLVRGVYFVGGLVVRLSSHTRGSSGSVRAPGVAQVDEGIVTHANESSSRPIEIEDREHDEPYDERKCTPYGKETISRRVTASGTWFPRAARCSVATSIVSVSAWTTSPVMMS
jgi:hypothetical protein